MEQTFALWTKSEMTLAKLKGAEGMTNKEILDFMNKGRANKYVGITNMKGKHLCKYCHEIVNGTDEDVLCKHCQETFGHSRYSQL